MRINRRIMLSLLLLCTSMYGQQNATPKWMNASLPPQERAQLLLKKMTIDEKIAQMDMMSMWDKKKITAEQELHTGIGFGAWIGKPSAEDYNRLQAYSEKSRLKIPYLVGNDAAHGDAMKSGRTVFPTSITMAATFNPELIEKAARLSSVEIRATGTHWTFAPSIDIVHDARWGRTGETYGEDPFLSATLVRAAIRGYQGDFSSPDNVATCAKHFLGGGASLGGVNHGHVEMSPRTMRTDFLPPFQAAIDEGVATIMPGHNDVNGIPMHASEELLTELVKNELLLSDKNTSNNLSSFVCRTADAIA